MQDITNPDVPTFDPRALPMLLTVGEVAAVLRLDQSTVYRAVQRGEVAAVRLSERDGAAIRIRAAELERILQDRPAQLAAGAERAAAGPDAAASASSNGVGSVSTSPNQGGAQ